MELTLAILYVIMIYIFIIWLLMKWNNEKMSLVGRQINFENLFGPYIVKTTISDELHKILLDTALKLEKIKKNKTQDYRNKLLVI